MLQCQATEDGGALQCALDVHEDDTHLWASRVNSWESALERVTVMCDDIAKIRHAKYGPENIKATGETGLWVRISDKLARISRAMTTGQFEFPDEKFEDAIIDIINYARFWLMWRAGQWELPSKSLGEEPLDLRTDDQKPLPDFKKRTGVQVTATEPDGRTTVSDGRGLHDPNPTVTACPSCWSTARGTNPRRVCRDKWH